jgi:thymidylate kinase
LFSNYLEITTYPVLQISENLFLSLNSLGIAYCHWKSNSHLAAGLSGDTDLDLLVQEDQEEPFREVLIRHDFKRVISPPPKQYPGIEHYLGFDFDAGKMAHIHVHYKLILGQRYYKNFHLPIEKFILSNLRVMESVYVPSMQVELLLLLIRASMKLGSRDILEYLMGQRHMPLPKGLSEEFGWLVKGFYVDEFDEALQKSGLPLSRVLLIEFAESLREGKLALTRIIGIRKHIFKALYPFRRYPRLWAFKRATFIRLASAPILKHFLHTSKKRLEGQGKTIALIGADGSGKTAMCRALTNCFGRKLWVKSYYLGSGQPTLHNRFLRLFVIPMLVPRRVWPSAYWARLLRYYAHGFIEFLNARDRLSRLRKGFRLASKGCIVFFDRYPISGVADQPTLLEKRDEFKDNPFARWMARKVYGIYRQMKEPDLFVHLSVAPEVAIARKPQHSREMIAAKETRLKLFSEKMAGSKRMLRVDASDSKERVFLDIIGEVWRRL